jgi:hypothetical protein
VRSLAAGKVPGDTYVCESTLPDDGIGVLVVLKMRRKEHRPTSAPKFSFYLRCSNAMVWVDFRNHPHNKMGLTPTQPIIRMFCARCVRVANGFVIEMLDLYKKRFVCGTARRCELPATPDLLRHIRLKLWLRNYFPGRG